MSYISKFENGFDMFNPTMILALQVTLEAEGVAFIPEGNDGGPGVLLTTKTT